MACPANVRETKLAFGFVPQTDLATSNTALQLWSLTKTNASLSTVSPVTEDDANDIGKGDEFPSQVFPSHMDVSGTIEKYSSSQFLAWTFAFALGKATRTAVGATGSSYLTVPADPVVDCLDLKPFTLVEQIRTGADAVVDRALVGCVISDFTWNLQSGPGRENSRIAVNFMGSGKVVTPSALAMPTVTPENFLNAASATISIHGVDYVLNKTFMSAELRWNNNPREGFYPGSGTYRNFAIRGRMEYGTRECMLTFVARARKGSDEFEALLDQTESTATISVSGAVIEGTDNHSAQVYFPRTRLSAVQEGEADGIVTINVTVRPLKGSGNPYVQFTTKTTKDGILAAA